MELAIFCFLAGFLTLLAPCILPVLPVILGRSLIAGDKTDQSIRKPVVIISSLLVSIVVFTLLLKGTTLLITIPTIVWSLLAGVIIIFFGITMLFPALWETIVTKLNIPALTNAASNRTKSGSLASDVLVGASLGPVFNSCSPTYALIVAAILPASFTSGLLYLFFYCLGLGIGLFIIAIFGRALTQKLRWTADPHGAFRKIIGVIFVVIGIGIILGIDKSVQTLIIDAGFYKPVESIEKSLFN